MTLWWHVRLNQGVAHLMTLFVKRTLTTRASSVISQSTENARRSTSARRLQMSSVRGLGSMSILRCTRYVVVALRKCVSFQRKNTQEYRSWIHSLRRC